MDKNLLFYKSVNLNPSLQFNLQRFASAESEGRTEKATEHKKKKARDEGRVALSKELPQVLISIAGFVSIYFLGKYYMSVLKDSFLYVFENIRTLSLDEGEIYYNGLLFPMLKLFAPVAIISVILGILGNYGQIGFKFTPKAVKPKLDKLKPDVFKFFQNQVFSVSSGFNLVKSIMKVILIVILTVVLIQSRLNEIINLMHIEDLNYSIGFICQICFDLIMQVLVLLLVLSIVDMIFVRWQYEEQLKMKKEEIKQEQKELYGDPQIKSRLKQMYNELLSQKKMLSEVPNSDVVITNPTHYAVALKYDSKVDEAPRVAAKGMDEFAQKIKQTAKDNGVFLYENVQLARKLYADVEVNEIIPRELYSFVIYAYKLAMEHKSKKEAEVVYE